MKFSLLLLVFFSLSARAQFMESLCEKRVQNIEYHLPFITDGESVWGEAGNPVFKNEQRYLSMAQSGETFYFLTKEEIIAKDVSGNTLRSVGLPSLSVLGYGKRLIAFSSFIAVLHDDGVSAFDVSKNEFSWIHSLNDLTGGVMVDATVIGDDLFVLLANGYESAFVGGVTIGQDGTRKKVQKWDLWRSGFIDHRARLHWVTSGLLLNNSGWMQFIDAKQLRGTKALRVKIAPTNVLDSRNNRRHLSLTGDFYFFQEAGKTQFSGCGKYTFEDNGELKQGAGLYSFNL